MESTIVVFKKKVKQLKNYLLLCQQIQSDIITIHQEGKFIPESLLKMVRDPNKKVFDYKLAILILYGAFENYIESILSSYIRKLDQNINHFSELPETIQKHHTELSTKLMANICSGYSKYEQLNIQNIIECLYKCYATPSDYCLNEAAFTQHSSNLRIRTVCDLLSNVGITSVEQKIIKNETFLLQLQKLDPELGELREDARTPGVVERCFNPLNGIVERRNDIAHGVDDADDNILSTDRLLEYSEYLQSLAIALYDIMLCECQKCLIQAQAKNVVTLGFPIALYNNNILCFHSGNYKISINDRIASLNAVGEIRTGKVLSIEVNHQTRQTILPSDNIDYGIKIDYKVTDSFNHYLIT